MFLIKTGDFSNKNFDDWKDRLDYHCVYILENGKDAYIGETNDVFRRMKEHDYDTLKNKLKKYNFKKLHVITGEDAEETPAKHFEKLLIKLMRVDQKFNIANSDDGEQTHYKRKNMFEKYFDKLWFQLEKKRLVKTKNFKLIMDSSAYKYSPYTGLTEEQNKALNSIIHTIDSGETKPHKKGFKARPILISGDAGTGKTVVATSLFYYLKNNERYKDKKIALVYANTSIRDEIQEVFKNIKGLYKKDVLRPIDITKQHYDIVICDEAHRLRRDENLGHYSKNFKHGNNRLKLNSSHDELDWILTNSNCQILFYDEKQIVSPSDITHDSFEGRLNEEKRGIRPIELNEQMRIKAGSDYVSYIYNMLNQRIDTMKVFENYDFKLFASLSDMVKLLDEKEENVGLCRLSSGYAWKWKAREDQTVVDISIDDVNIQWNTQTKGWLRNSHAKKEMGSIYTLAGLDLNYAGVVIGPDIFYDKSDNKIKVNRDSFFDNKVKIRIADKELREYIINTYGVLLTRGISGTYVYVHDENLREYLKSYIALA